MVLHELQVKLGACSLKFGKGISFFKAQKTLLILELSKMKFPYQISKVVNVFFKLEVRVSYTVEVCNYQTTVIVDLPLTILYAITIFYVDVHVFTCI